jgi:hypothetical protein
LAAQRALAAAITDIAIGAGGVAGTAVFDITRRPGLTAVAGIAITIEEALVADTLSTVTVGGRTAGLTAVAAVLVADGGVDAGLDGVAWVGLDDAAQLSNTALGTTAVADGIVTWDTVAFALTTTGLAKSADRLAAGYGISTATATVVADLARAAGDAAGATVPSVAEQPTTPRPRGTASLITYADLHCTCSGFADTSPIHTKLEVGTARTTGAAVGVVALEVAAAPVAAQLADGTSSAAADALPVHTALGVGAFAPTGTTIEWVSRHRDAALSTASLRVEAERLATSEACLRAVFSIDGGIVERQAEAANTALSGGAIWICAAGLGREHRVVETARECQP